MAPRDMWRAVCDAAPVGLAVFDRQLRVVDINAELCRIDDRPAAEHIGRTVTELFPDETGDVAAQLVRSVFDTGQRVDPTRLRGAQPHSGGHKVVMASCFPLTDDDGQVVAAACSVIDLTDLTDLADLEQRLQRTDTRLRALVASAPIGVLDVGADGRVVHANPSSASMLGADPHELVGLPLRDISGDLHAALAAPIERVRQSGEATELGEFVVRDALGDEHHWRASVAALDPAGPAAGVGVMVWDVSEQHRSDRRRRALMDGLFTFVGMLDRDGTVVEANRTALDAAGLVADEVEGRPFHETYWWAHDRSVQEQLRQAIARGRGGEISRYDTVVRLKGDQLVTIDFQLVPLVEGYDVTGMVVSGLDVTDRLEHQHQLEAMAGMARALSAAPTTNALAQIIVDPDFRSATGASFVNLGLVEPDSTEIEMVQPDDLRSDISARYQTVPLDAPIGLAATVREERTIVITGPDSEGGAYASNWADIVAAGLSVVATVPLFRADGSIGGVLGLGWPDAVDPSSGALRSRIGTMAEMVAQSLERTRSTDLRLDLIRNLQSELLPVVPVRDKLDISVRYLAATTELGFGGDWYEIRELDRHRSAILVGDIAGHGVRAAAQMTQVRSVINALLELGVARDDLDLGRLFHDASLVLGREGHEFLGTATVALIDTRVGQISWVSAGHPPLVLCCRDGSPELLEGGRQLPLGLPTEVIQAPSRPFGRGDTLLAYTDGLFERKGETVDEGLARLGDAVEQLHGSTSDAVADGMLAALLEQGDQRDDIALVVAVAG